MPNSSGESLKRAIAALSLPILSAFTPMCLPSPHSNTSPLLSFVAVYITVLRLSGVSLCWVSQQLVPGEHICTVQSPGCRVSDTNGVHKSLLVPLPNCLSGPLRCNIRPVLTAWIVPWVWTISCKASTSSSSAFCLEYLIPGGRRRKPTREP